MHNDDVLIHIGGTLDDSAINRLLRETGEHPGVIGAGIIEHPTRLLAIVDEGPLARWRQRFGAAVLPFGLTLHPEQALDLRLQSGAEVIGRLRMAHGLLQDPVIGIIGVGLDRALERRGASLPPRHAQRRQTSTH